MDRALWQRVETVFQDALERPAATRAAFLDESCAGNSALRAEVDRLLAQHDADPHFLETPLIALPATEGDTAATPVEPAYVGPYRLVRVLGEGGMGTVYLAVQEGPGFERPVALKVIRRGMDTDEVLRRFQLERRILAALRHPNIAHLLDAGATADGRPFFAMQFIEGVPLDAYCERHQLAIPQRLRLFQVVCGAVQYAHSNLIVHRDLKPGNILVGTDGSPVLLDFGIGKLLDSVETAGTSATRTGMRAFTPEYASPEQVRGELVGTATDVYGLGMLLYRILTGRHPYQAETAAEMERAVLEAEPRRMDRADLDNIVLRALHKEPERRYPSVAAFADDIQRYLDGMPVRARPDTFGYRAGKFVRRHRWPLAAATAAFVALAAASVYSAAQARAVARERDKALEVQGFLLEMFGASGRDQADSVSIRQLLDRQAAAVPTAYAARPELEAQMMAVIAEGYDRLGLLDQAEPLARQALAIRRGVLRRTHPDMPASLSLLGWILHERGQSKEGEVLLREALDRWPGARPANPGAYSRTLNDLGVVREAAGDYAEAASLYDQALAIRRRRFGPNDRSVAITGSNLAVVRYRQADYAGAVAAAEEALAIMRRSAGPDHQRSTLIQGNLAAMRAALGDLQGAEAEYRDLLARQTRVQGRQHPVTGGTLSALGSVLRTQHKYAGADSCLSEALAIFEAALGPEHARVAGVLTLLGGVRSSMGRFAEARPFIERALAIQRKLRGETHRDVAQTLSTLAALHGNMGNWDAAERTYRQALAVWERALGDRHLDVATARAQLASVLLRRGDALGAEGLYRAAYQAMLAAGVSTSPVQDVRLRLAQALIGLGRYTEADSLVALNAAGLGAEAGPRQRLLLDSVRTALRERAP